MMRVMATVALLSIALTAMGDLNRAAAGAVEAGASTYEGAGGKTIAVDSPHSRAIARAAAQAEAGDTIQLVAGEYETSEPILLESGVRLLGAGQGITILRPTGDFAGAVIGMHGVKDVEVGRLSLECEGNRSLNQGISATNSTRLHIHDVTIRNLMANGAFGPMGIHFNGQNPTREGGVTDSLIERCTLEGIGIGASFGSGIRLSWGSSRNEVRRCSVRGTGRGGIFGDNGSTDLVIVGNVVTGSGGEGLGIEVWGGCDRSVIEDNDIDHWLSIGGCDVCAVRRNTIRSASGSSKSYGLEIIGSYCIVTDNAVDETQGIGISVSGNFEKDYHYYARNEIRNCYHWGAQIQGEEPGATYHYYYQCAFGGTQVGHPSVIYKGDEGNGFRTNGNVRHLVFEECDFSGNGKHGLQLGGPNVDYLTFLRCAIKDNQGAACVGPGEYTALNWIGCTVEGNASNELPEGKPYAWSAEIPTGRASKAVRTGDSSTYRAALEAETVMWDFGEGPPVLGGEVKHAFAQRGEYPVAYVAWAADGRVARREMMVKVRE